MRTQARYGRKPAVSQSRSNANAAPARHEESDPVAEIDAAVRLPEFVDRAVVQ